MADIDSIYQQARDHHAEMDRRQQVIFNETMTGMPMTVLERIREVETRVLSMRQMATLDHLPSESELFAVMAHCCAIVAVLDEARSASVWAQVADA